jgi:nucleoid-associated protein YgaU
VSLEKLVIKFEIATKGKLDGQMKVLFNPNKLSYQRSLNWKTVDPALLPKQGRRGRLQFQSIVPETLSVELFFDTYELSSQSGGLLGALSPLASAPPTPTSVLLYTRRIEALANYMTELDRPPVCELSWGLNFRIFTGVLTQMSKTLDLFHENGTPLRATMACSFTDVLFTGELHSPDVAKTYVVKPRDTLLGIAAELYEDASLWRVIAQANGIDDPRVLTPGQILAIPPIQ